MTDAAPGVPLPTDVTAVSAEYAIPHVPVERARNIVWIYGESLERTYLDPQVFPDLMPHLSRLAEQAADFRGIASPEGSGWTIAGLVSSMCGVPLTTARGDENAMGRMGRFLPGAYCLGDYLKQQGYRLHFSGGADAAFAGARQRQAARVLDDRGKIFDMFGNLATRDEIAQAPNDLSRAERFFRGFADCFTDEDAAGFVAPVEQLAGGFHVIGDRGQRLIQFVRQGRGHGAHRAHARNVNQLGLQFLEPQFRPLLIGEVADESGEDTMAIGIHLADRQFHRKRASVAAFAHDDAADPDDAAGTGGQIVRDIIVVAVLIGIWHQHADIASDQLGFGITEQPFRCGAERHDDAAFVDHDHRARHRRQDRTNVQFALGQSLLGRLPSRHVVRAMAEAPDRSLIIAQRKDRHVGQKLRSVLADTPRFGAQRRRFRGLLAIGGRAVRGDVPLGIEQVDGPPADLFQ